MKKFFPPRGFTLIEVLVVIIVTSILATAGVAYFRDNQRRQQLEAQSQVLAGALRQVQVFAYTGRVVATDQRPASYGIHFTGGTDYLLFADLGGVALRYDACTDTVIENFTIPLPFQLSGVGISITDIDVAFSIPNGPVYVNGLAPSPDQRLRFTDPVTGLTKDVVINGVSGQVEIE